MSLEEELKRIIGEIKITGEETPQSNCDVCHGMGQVRIETKEGLSKNLLPCPNCDKGKALRDEILTRRHQQNKLPQVYLRASFDTWKITVKEQKKMQGKLLAYVATRDIAHNNDLSSYRVATQLSYMLKDKPEFIQQWMENPQVRPGLVLWGDYGVGKTYLMSCALNHFSEHGYQTRYIRFRDLVQDLRDTWRSDIATGDVLNELINVPVLFIDDLSDNSSPDEPLADHVQGFASTIFRRRLPEWKVTLITTNWSKPEMRYKIGEQAAQAMFEGVHYLKMGGDSLRSTSSDMEDITL